MEMARWGTSASKGPWVAVRASVGTAVLAALSSSAEVTRSPSPERRGEPRSWPTLPAAQIRCQVWGRPSVVETEGRARLVDLKGVAMRWQAVGRGQVPLAVTRGT